MKKVVVISLFMVLLFSSLFSGQWSVANAQGTVPVRATGGIIPITGSPIIVAGLGHTCVTTDGSRVLCWGFNSSGQDGDGTFTNQLVPVYVKDLSGVVALTAGSLHTCALTNAGEVWCWGDNTFGQLGDGTTENRNVPVMVKDLPGKVISFTGGEDFTCAQLENKEIFCWGKNDTGQLNDGTTTNHLLPVISKLELIQNEISGGQTTLLGEAAGDVAQWNELKSAEVSNLSTSLSISANRFAPGGCAVTVSGEVQCWGGDLKSAAVEKASSTLLVGTGMEHSCAVNTDLTVSCWGDNQYGELGNGTKVANSIAVNVKNLSDVGNLAVGAHHGCVLMGDGNTVKCWGWNTYGQLGDKSTIDSSVPVLVHLPTK
jgi:alpha-tubulin suppressor-like RCC1 family protein